MNNLLFYQRFPKRDVPVGERTFGCLMCDPYFLCSCEYQDWDPQNGDPEPILEVCGKCRVVIASGWRSPIGKLMLEVFCPPTT